MHHGLEFNSKSPSQVEEQDNCIVLPDHWHFRRFERCLLALPLPKIANRSKPPPEVHLVGWNDLIGGGRGLGCQVRRTHHGIALLPPLRRLASSMGRLSWSCEGFNDAPDGAVD